MPTLAVMIKLFGQNLSPVLFYSLRLRGIQCNKSSLFDLGLLPSIHLYLLKNVCWRKTWDLSLNMIDLWMFSSSKTCIKRNKRNYIYKTNTELLLRRIKNGIGNDYSILFTWVSKVVYLGKSPNQFINRISCDCHFYQ